MPFTSYSGWISTYAVPIEFSEVPAFNQRILTRFSGTFPYPYHSQAKEGMMAHRAEVILEDDIDGGPADETVRFAYDGRQYEIDLSSQNADVLRSSLGKYIEHARKAHAAPRQPRGSRNHRADTAAVRAWAKEQGKEINDRGRIPASVMEEYQAAQRS
jgi:hypothetical protein